MLDAGASWEAIARRQNQQRWIVFAAVAVVVVAAAVMSMAFMSSETESSSSLDTTRTAALASEHSPSLGDAAASVHIVEFIDPACGTCAMFYPMVKGWLAEAPDQLRLSIRHVTFHTGVEYAVRILEASRKQDKYWETLEALLNSQRQWVTNHVVQPDRVLPAIASVGLDIDQLMQDMESAEVLARIEQDKQDAITLQVSATPEYFVNGRPLPSFGQQQLLDLVREELEKAN